MTNAGLYVEWITSRGLAGAVPMPDDQGYFWRNISAHELPYLRVYWKARSQGAGVDEAPEAPWEPDTWQRVGSGFVRFMRADQVLGCMEADLGPNPSKAALIAAIKRTLRPWLLAVEDIREDSLNAFKRRVETIRLLRARRRIRWSRRVRLFPDDLRGWLPLGLDPVHTPESTHAGLTRYLCEGWSIDDEGALQASTVAEHWGPSTIHIPHRLHNAPRRLMLGASLQARGVPLVENDPPPDADPSNPATPPGRMLRVAFTMLGGWTHEDAVVISESASHSLARRHIRTASLLIPAVAARINLGDLGIGSTVRHGQVVARAFIDLYALGLRRHEAEEEGAADGWLEVALPGASAPMDGDLIDLRREREYSRLWRERITYSIERTATVGIGDKLSTRHGIKGVVSRIVPDGEMPIVSGQPAEIVLSPLGIIRRGAMGQFREVIQFTQDTLPKSGTIFVMRQRQDAALPERCRVRGPERDDGSASPGQRYGEMEFTALMAHGARNVAAELLSVQRSTASWMRWEERIASGDHRELATRALNRYLGVVGVRYEGGRLRAAPALANTQRIEIRPNSLVDNAAVKNLLDDPERFVQRDGLVVLSLGQTLTITLDRSGTAGPVEIDQVHLLPPWLRPTAPEEAHPLTGAYHKLLDALTLRSKDTAGLERAVRNCVTLALDARDGAGGFLRREVLGRRLTRSARAVIVPRPDLRIDQIAIPPRIADSLFAGLSEEQRSLVLVNRNPTLHRRGLLALRPVVDSSDSTSAVFGLPLGVLKVLGGDFDGDQATVVALETEAALAEADRLMPGALDLRSDPFRPNTPAFPLAGELADTSDDDREAVLAADQECSQEQWSTRHHSLLQDRLDELGDGWEHPLVLAALESPDNAALWRGLTESEWRARAAEEMEVIYRAVRRKGRFGGILRREFYRRGYQNDEPFWHSLQALQAITERATQAALSTKTGQGARPFSAERYFRDPSSPDAQEMLRQLDPTLDVQSIAKAVGSSQKPLGILAWMLKPDLHTLVETMDTDTVEGAVNQDDPRVAWFL